MKIAIITLPLHTNYGGILQAYALQTLLQRLGHDAELLESKAPRMHHPLLMPLVWMKRMYRKFIKGEDIEVFRSNVARTQQFIRPFIRKHINLKLVKQWDSTLAQQYDCIVVGSDQIWRPQYTSIPRAFCEFAHGTTVRRIAYAASFGTSDKEYTSEHIQICKPLIAEFSAVSVREDSGVTLCKKYFGVDAEHVLDPTMLLSQQDYELLCKNTQKSSGNMLVYVLDETPDISKFISDVAETKKLEPFRVNSKVEQWDAPICERIQPPLEQWLKGFMDAEFVITDSFHACVFSILFHKPFIVVRNEYRGLSRIHSLLGMFNITDRLVSIVEEPTLKKIDWQEIENILHDKKNHAMSYLQDNL